MIPSLRCLHLLAFSAPLWLLGGLVPGGWLAAVAFLFLLLLLCVREIRIAPQAAEVQITRRVPARFSLGEERSIELTFVNRSNFRLRVELRDELPDALEQLAPIASVEVPSLGRATCSYPVRARRRGPHQFGRLVFRIQYGLGLVLK